MNEETKKAEENTEIEENTDLFKSPQQVSKKRKWTLYISLFIFAGASLALAYFANKFMSTPPQVHTMQGCPMCGMG